MHATIGTIADTDLQTGACPAAQHSIAVHNGYVTIHNPATGNHRTFRIRTQPSNSTFAPGERIVSLLTGPSNENDYTGFGFVNADGKIRLWKRYRDSVAFRKYAAMLEDPQTWIDRYGLSYMNESRCRRCNRLLTDPESIARGTGPECSEKI